MDESINYEQDFYPEDDEDVMISLVEEIGGDRFLVGNALDGSSDELFTDYALEIAGSLAGSSREKKTAGKKLSGTERKLYDILKEEIAKVAAGERASTVFEITLEAIGMDDIHYTAADLGVESLISGDSISQEAIDVLYANPIYSFLSVRNALLVDCPYQLYWFDKTTEIDETPYSIIVDYDEEIDEYVLSYTGTISF